MSSSSRRIILVAWKFRIVIYNRVVIQEWTVHHCCCTEGAIPCNSLRRKNFIIVIKEDSHKILTVAWRTTVPRISVRRLHVICDPGVTLGFDFLSIWNNDLIGIRLHALGKLRALVNRDSMCTTFSYVPTPITINTYCVIIRDASILSTGRLSWIYSVLLVSGESRIEAASITTAICAQTWNFWDDFSLV